MERMRSDMEGDIAAYAVEARAALGLFEPRARGRLAPVGARPRFIGVKTAPKRRAESQRIEGEEPEAKRRAPKFDFFRDLPLDMLQPLLAEILFPYELLHLNTMGPGLPPRYREDLAGIREMRARSFFEKDMAAAMRRYIAAYRQLRGVSRRVYSIIHHPYMRESFYNKWFRTAPEGLYEQPDPSAIPSKSERNELLASLPPPIMSGIGGGMHHQWYPDLLATIAYNEWQRAITMSSARALQLLFWAYSNVGRAGPLRADFLEYWNANPDVTSAEDVVLDKSWVQWRDDQGIFQAKVYGAIVADPMLFRLTADINYRRFITATPSPQPPPGVQFQSFDQTSFRMHEAGLNWFPMVSPSNAAFGRMVSMNRIEVVRLMRFKNTLRPRKMNYRGNFNMNLAISTRSGQIRIRLAPPPIQVRGTPVGAPRAVIALDPPCDMALGPVVDEEYYNPHGGFNPFSSEFVVVRLHGFAPQSLVLLQRFMQSLRASRVGYDGEFGYTMVAPHIHLDVEISDPAD